MLLVAYAAVVLAWIVDGRPNPRRRLEHPARRTTGMVVGGIVTLFGLLGLVAAAQAQNRWWLAIVLWLVLAVGAGVYCYGAVVWHGRTAHLARRAGWAATGTAMAVPSEISLLLLVWAIPLGIGTLREASSVPLVTEEQPAG